MQQRIGPVTVTLRGAGDLIILYEKVHLLKKEASQSFDYELLSYYFYITDIRHNKKEKSSPWWMLSK
jgi:hypothetical protein